ncbi:MAG TPA: chitosanase [Pyrinomonadaceae bacterium]|nr:chitosanase [Pyrinomonadaceae bacterium]HMP66614.1 chitosanase [Pyrinomonadaceae bacterium]
MKHTIFSERTIDIAQAIVRIFETGTAAGRYSEVAVLNDGAGISYGISQFTHRSGALQSVVELYLSLGGRTGRDTLTAALPLLRKRTFSAITELTRNRPFRQALAAAGPTPQMRAAQDTVAYERYMLPAVAACAGSGFVLPLSLAVIYDSMTHGSYHTIRDRIRIPRGELSAEAFEKRWITEYTRRRDVWLGSIPRLRATRYRTRFFLGQIAIGRWRLELPLNVNGYLLTTNDIDYLPALNGRADTADAHPQFPSYNNPADHPPQPDPTFTPIRTRAHPSKFFDSQGEALPGEQDHILDRIERRVDAAVGRFDQVERMTLKAANRTDRAKSLWATVAGTMWQTGWAVFGALAGMPREMWLAAAVIAALLTLGYLYRQITLGRLRESAETNAV